MTDKAKEGALSKRWRAAAPRAAARHFVGMFRSDLQPAVAPDLRQPNADEIDAAMAVEIGISMDGARVRE